MIGGEMHPWSYPAWQHPCSFLAPRCLAVSNRFRALERQIRVPRLADALCPGWLERKRDVAGSVFAALWSGGAVITYGAAVQGLGIEGQGFKFGDGVGCEAGIQGNKMA